jgi:hypothetical protein
MHSSECLDWMSWYISAGKPNVMTAAWAGICFSGMVSGKDTDKFAATGLTAERSKFIGETRDIKADAAVFGEDGLPNGRKIFIVRRLPYISANHDCE